jgi:hypothetical protein
MVAQDRPMTGATRPATCLKTGRRNQCPRNSVWAMSCAGFDGLSPPSRVERGRHPSWPSGRIRGRSAAARHHRVSGTTIGEQSGAPASDCVCALIGLRLAAGGRSCGGRATLMKPSVSRVVALQIGLDIEGKMIQNSLVVFQQGPVASWLAQRRGWGDVVKIQPQEAAVRAALAAGNAALLLVPVLRDASRPARANISLDAGTLEAIDEASREHGLTRSAFIASATREKIERGT